MLLKLVFKESTELEIFRVLMFTVSQNKEVLYNKNEVSSSDDDTVDNDELLI